jgi:N-acetylglucosamine transport system permease protein
MNRIKQFFADHPSLAKYSFIYGFITIPLAFYVIFYLFPNILSVYYSFMKWSGLSDPKFIGLQNYTRLFKDPFFYSSLLHNFVLMLMVPLITLSIALVLAFFLARGKSKRHDVLQALFFVPNIISSVVIGLLWAFIYNGDFGLLNALLGLFGMDMDGFWWLGNMDTALMALVPVYVWVNVGFYTLIFTNAIKGIPDSLYENAILEGATEGQILRKIVIPMIMGVISVSALFLVLMTFRSYDLVLILTGGGPGGATQVVGLYMFSMVFQILGTAARTPSYGYASAIGIILFIILIAAKWVIDKLTTTDDIEF